MFCSVAEDFSGVFIAGDSCEISSDAAIPHFCFCESVCEFGIVEEEAVACGAYSCACLALDTVLCFFVEDVGFTAVFDNFIYWRVKFVVGVVLFELVFCFCSVLVSFGGGGGRDVGEEVFVFVDEL